MRFGILHLNAYLVILGETSVGKKTKEEKSNKQHFTTLKEAEFQQPKKKQQENEIKQVIEAAQLLKRMQGRILYFLLCQVEM